MRPPTCIFVPQTHCKDSESYRWYKVVKGGKNSILPPHFLHKLLHNLPCSRGHCCSPKCDLSNVCSYLRLIVRIQGVPGGTRWSKGVKTRFYTLLSSTIWFITCHALGDIIRALNATYPTPLWTKVSISKSRELQGVQGGKNAILPPPFSSTTCNVTCPGVVTNIVALKAP